jgi:hypothetical protein
MTDFSTIAGWSIMTPREKWNTVARFQKRRKRLEHKREYDRSKRAEKQKARIVEPIPGGYYPMAEIVQRQPIAISTIKRYISKKQVRVYRKGYHVAICEYDVILAIEAGKRARSENGKARRGNKS